MDRVFFEIKEIRLLSPSQQPYLLSQSPPPPIANPESNGFSLNSKVSPSILLIIVILAIIFFVSGFLHLLVRFLLRPPNRDPDDFDNVTALQGQLQQLFHLHDAGVDQSFIDTLPVFNYKAIIGLKDPFDCAVCLCEFEAEDKLRLLPKCSHAFHMDCIDTWLLSHSTCPLCRASLLPDFSPHNSCSPIVLVLESGSDSSRDILLERDGVLGSTNLGHRANSHLGCRREDEFGSSPIAVSHKSCEILMKDYENRAAVVGSEETVLPVKLGKFRNVDGGAGGAGSSTSNVDSRRCFSMGSFVYVMEETSSLQVPIKTPVKKQSNKKPSLPLTHGLRQAMSECDCDSRREFNGFEPFKGFDFQGGGGGSGIGNDTGSGNAIGSSKRESFSVSKIWLLGKKDKPNSTAAESSRRASSLRFPVHQNVVFPNDLKAKNVESGRRSSISEIDLRRWENGGGDFGGDEECQSCNGLEFQAKTPSFTRRTLLWLVGRQNKVVHSSSSPNV